MHIALGAFLLSGQPGYRQAGIHQYIKHLLHTLPAVAPADVSFSAFISPTASDEIDDNVRDEMDVILADRATEHPLARIITEQTRVPGKIAGLHADLYHGMAFALPAALRVPGVVTIYDLSFITQPRAHKVFNRAYLNIMARFACRKARRVIAISEHTRHDVLAHFRVPAAKVDAIPLGVLPRFSPQSPVRVTSFKQAKHIGEGSIFYLGSIEPRKNLDRLLDAFVALHTRMPDLPAELLVGGGLGWKFDETLVRIRRLGIQDRVKLIGRVPDDELPLWYTACDVFAYPSLYEGFGLPVLEAMACGALVVTSNTTSLPEVVGDAGLLIDPENVEQLSMALQSALTQSKQRAELRARAVVRASQFTWERTARETLAVYRKALDEGGA